MEAQYLQKLFPALPDELATTLRSLCSTPNVEPFVEEFLRFVIGAGPTAAAGETLRRQWQERQTTARGTILSLLGSPQSQSDSRKRALNDNDATTEHKRQKMSPPSSDSIPANDPPVFIIHSVSATSPVRKKVDITIGKATITFKQATSGNLEATVPLSSIRRAFLLPTRGKSKAHWTVVLLSSDSPDRDKSNNVNTQDSPQIIFGLDATATAPLSTTSFADGAEPTRDTTPKGNPSLPSIRQFLSRLIGVQLYEPTTDVFKSACNGIGSNASPTGIPGVEAYRAAKQGNLWFMKEGILWGENKPCEFWAVEDLLNGVGVRLSPGSGRVFSITLTRKVESTKAGGEQEGEDEPEGIETEMGMVDSRERDVVAEWVRKHQNLFGRKAGEAPSAEELKQLKQKVPQFAGPMTIHQLAAASDSEDEDFEGSSSEGEGSLESGSDSEEGSDDNSDDDDNAEGTGDDSEEDDGGEEEEEELNPERHPLMRPGAMPKMSKSAMDMVVGIVEDELMGDDNEPEEDELDDD